MTATTTLNHTDVDRTLYLNRTYIRLVRSSLLLLSSKQPHPPSLDETSTMDQIVTGTTKIIETFHRRRYRAHVTVAIGLAERLSPTSMVRISHIVRLCAASSDSDPLYRLRDPLRSQIIELCQASRPPVEGLCWMCRSYTLTPCVVRVPTTLQDNGPDYPLHLCSLCSRWTSTLSSCNSRWNKHDIPTLPTPRHTDNATHSVDSCILHLDNLLSYHEQPTLHDAPPGLLLGDDTGFNQEVFMEYIIKARQDLVEAMQRRFATAHGRESR